VTEFRAGDGAFLWRFERPILLYIAKRLPAWITPDMLTRFGLVGAVLAFIGYVASNLAPAFLWLASLGLLLNWLGDSLDGTLARVRNQKSPRYGFFVDHTADLVTLVLVGVGLGLSSYITMHYALLLLTAYLAFVAHTFIRAHVFKTVQNAYYSIGPTETRLALIVGNMLLFLFPALSVPTGSMPVSTADLVCICIAIFAFGALLVHIYKDWRILLEEESARLHPCDEPMRVPETAD
jgi:archaetidylinositol phosphate synthase